MDLRERLSVLDALAAVGARDHRHRAHVPLGQALQVRDQGLAGQEGGTEALVGKLRPGPGKTGFFLQVGTSNSP